MNFRFQFRRYRLPFRAPVRTAHGIWSEREGVIVRLEAESGVVGYGEAAPIPWFGTETADEVESACRELGEKVDAQRIASVPERLGCLRNALREAQRIVQEVTEAAERKKPEGKRSAPSPPPSPAKPNPSALGVAALLPAGRPALAAIAPKADAGFRVFKWKVGVGDIADELGVLDDLCAALPNGGKLRLDANGALDRRRAERWLERTAERPVEFFEQPCFAEASQGAALHRRTEDILIGLANDYPTPIALDESLVGDGDVARWLGAGWPGIFVVKPSLFADVDRALAQLAAAKASVVFSSALETPVGARAALRRAFAWTGEPGSTGSPQARAFGFGVWPLFKDSIFNPPFVGPFIRREDVDQLNPEAAWNALS